jgi:hypothetical protein
MITAATTHAPAAEALMVFSVERIAEYLVEDGDYHAACVAAVMPEAARLGAAPNLGRGLVYGRAADEAHRLLRAGACRRCAAIAVSVIGA